MKYLWWFIGDRDAPVWVHLVIALAWFGLIFLAYYKRGYCFNMVFNAWAFGVRGEMFLYKYKLKMKEQEGLKYKQGSIV